MSAGKTEEEAKNKLHYSGSPRYATRNLVMNRYYRFGKP
jgi:hypothetical protein